ncbi:hypothetical protein [Mycobacterium sp. E3198]|uniref:hypothetical protein n=1 Tax=Mycobacterium sp. E3198 TaxID=1834143 RepID=UPI00080132CB|nr:hypothetical protein [Mycobacterium sp. E3198]OBG26388.1 hypothetical protein A5673_08270 [Mycobacterium sp. E3198]
MRGNGSAVAEDGIPAGIRGIERGWAPATVIVSVNGELIWNVPVETKDDNGKPLPTSVFLKAWDASNELTVVTT